MFRKFFAVLVFGALVFASCAGNSNNILIGAISPTTGDQATFGQSSMNAFNLAAEQWNAKGGLLGKQIKLITADTKGDPIESATVVTKLIDQDKVVAIIGPDTSTEALAAGPIAQAKGIPMIATSASNIKVTQIGDYIFRACFIDPFQGTVMAKYIYGELNLKTAAVIYDMGADYSKGLAEVFKNGFEASGGKIVAFESHPPKTTDFKAQLSKIIAAKPDAIFIPDFYNDVGLITRQARELGFKGLFAGGDGWDSPQLAQVGGAAVEGGIFTGSFSVEDKSQLVVDFLKAYNDKYKMMPDQHGALAYHAANILFNSIQAAGKTDGAAIKAAMAAIQYEGITGKMHFDENRNPVTAAVIIQMKDGQPHYVKTINP